MTQHILIAEPHQETAKQLQTLFENHNFQVTLTNDGPGTYKKALDHELDVAIIEIALPHKNGLEVVKSIREYSNLPILILSRDDNLANKQIAFEYGANDFIIKPCSFLEVLSRIKALLMQGDTITNSKRTIQFGPIEMDTFVRTITYQKKELELTKAEFNILELLIKSPNQAFSKKELTELALKRDFTAYDRSIDVHISNLRHKLGKTPTGEDWIKTVRGFGYLINDD